jgi:hypothetical protein
MIPPDCSIGREESMFHIWTGHLLKSHSSILNVRFFLLACISCDRSERPLPARGAFRCKRNVQLAAVRVGAAKAPFVRTAVIARFSPNVYFY